MTLPTILRILAVAGLFATGMTACRNAVTVESDDLELEEVPDSPEDPTPHDTDAMDDDLSLSLTQGGTVFVVPLWKDSKGNCQATSPAGGCAPEGLVAAVRAFQGLANRSGPRVYVINDKSDEDILKTLTPQLPAFTYVPLGSTWELFTRPELADVSRKMVIFTRRPNPVLINAAFTVAAVQGAIPVEAALVPHFQSIGYSQLPGVAGDLRRFKRPAASEAWAFKTFRKKCSNTMYGISTGYLNPDSLRPKGHDYNVKRKACTWLLAQEPGHKNVNGVNTVKVQKHILRSYKPLTLAFGIWGSEVADMKALPKYGHVVWVPGYNHSFWSHLRAKTLPRIPRGPIQVPFNAGKSYATLVITQGSDGGGYHANYNFDTLTATMPGSTRPLREVIPFSVMFSAFQMELQAPLAKFLAREATPRQSFLDKGYGYANFADFQPAWRAAWLRKANTWLQRANIDHFVTNDTAITEQIYQEVVRVIKPKSVFHIFDNQKGGKEDDEVTFLGNVPRFTDPVHLRVSASESLLLDQTVEAIADSANKRRFFFIAIEYIGPVEIAQLYQKIQERAPKLELVDADTLAHMATQHGRP